MFFDLNLRRGGNLLEIGCGPGEFLYAAKQAGYTVTGIDFNQYAVGFAHERYGLESVYHISVGDFLAAGRGQTYDIICMFEVLEHLEDPLAHVRSLRELLVPGGYLVITTPGHRRWPPLFYEGIDVPPHHLTLWSKRSIEVLFQRCGVDLVLVRPSKLRPQNLFHTVSMSCHLAREETALYKGLRLFEYLADHFIAAVLRAGVRHAGGFFVFAVAQKPETDREDDP